MTRTLGYTRPLVDDDTAADVAVLRAAGATPIFVEAVPADDAPELYRCLEALTPGDVLVVTSAARLTSSATKFVRTLAGLHARGIIFRSLREPALSTDEPPEEPGEVFVAVEALRAELASIRARKKRDAGGERLRGRPSVMTPERVAMAQELRRHDRSLAHIAGVLGVSASAVQRALAAPHDQNDT